MLSGIRGWHNGGWLVTAIVRYLRREGKEDQMAEGKNQTEAFSLTCPALGWGHPKHLHSQ